MRRAILGLAMAGCALLTPNGLWAGDTELAQQIAGNLKNSGKMHGYSIGVKVQEGTVWLNGSVASQEQLAAALDIVQDTPGIEKIVNGVAVRDSANVQQATAATSGAANAQLAVGGQSDYNNPEFDAPSPVVGPTGRPVAEYNAPGTNSAAARSVMAAPHASPMAMPIPMASAPASYNAPNAPRVASHPQSVQPMPVQMMSQSAPSGAPIPAYVPANAGGGIAPAHFDHPNMPGYAWPSYASYPNYAALTYPRQYSPTAWPFIGPFYPYPQVPLGWRKVSLEWHNGWWMLDFNDGCH